MKVAYIAKAMIPSKWAHGIHIMKICEAFSEITDGFLLILLEPESKENINKECFSYYGVKTFDIKSVRINLKNWLMNRYGFAIKAMHKALSAGADAIVTRDPLTAFAAVCVHKHVVLDLHGDLIRSCGRAYRIIKSKWFVENKYLHLVAITKGVADFYFQKYGVPKECFTVLPDGFTEKNFTCLEETPILQNERLNIGYCGSFLKGKGLETIYKLSQLDAGNNYYLYGGTKDDAEREIQGTFPNNVYFRGYIPNSEIPAELNKQDILLLPNSIQQVCRGEDIGKLTSPLKMFEYMASGRIIVASDIPVLKEILNEGNCYFAKPDDASDWKQVIDSILVHRENARQRAHQASIDVKNFTWTMRAKKMIELFN